MSKVQKKKTLNPIIREMEKHEEKPKPLLTEEIRKELNKPYDPGISAVVRKVKKRKSSQ